MMTGNSNLRAKTSKPLRFGGAAGSFSQRRPKSVAKEARRRLAESSYQYLQSVQCQFDSGTLTIRGSVPSFYLKQIAQTICHGIDGVDKIVNAVDVVNPRGVSSVREAS